jgi:hypothetical protein
LSFFAERRALPVSVKVVVRIAKRKKVYGVREAMALHWTTRAKSDTELFEEVPTLACRRTPERIALLVQLKAFRAAYRKAWLAFSAGFHDVVFPHGTWKMVAIFGARAAVAA